MLRTSSGSALRSGYHRHGVTLDSGADISVLLKMHMLAHGDRSQRSRRWWMPKAKALSMRIRVQDKKGKVIELVEEFILGNVQHPILCAGRLLRRGWCLGGTDGVLCLKHEEKSVDIPLNTERNSLQFEAQVVEVNNEKPPETSTTARILQAISASMRRVWNWRQDGTDFQMVWQSTVTLLPVIC